MHPIRKFKEWQAQRKFVRKSEIQIYASRTTTFPLEQCTRDDLLTAARYNTRQAVKYDKRPDSQRHLASAQWNRLAAEALTELADLLKPGQMVEELPIKKRKHVVNTMLRITQGKAK